MRTAVLVVIGIVMVLAAMSLIGERRRRAAGVVLTIVWMGVVVWNLMTGLSHGYTLGEELPIQLVILLPPTLLAWWMARKRS